MWDAWGWSYGVLRPEAVEGVPDAAEAKRELSSYYELSYEGSHPLKYYSGVGLRTSDCAGNGIAEVGFVGRVLMNAHHALEYGLAEGRGDLVRQAESVFGSYLEHGFTAAGLLRERVDYGRSAEGREDGVYSIRRQSEGVCAILSYLEGEESRGREHPGWDSRARALLDVLAGLQREDGSFPRKFSGVLEPVDSTGGSTASAERCLPKAAKRCHTRPALEV